MPYISTPSLAELRILLGLCLASIVLSPLARADVKLPAIFSDHMVLQQDSTSPVWGWAKANEEVAVTIAGQTQKAIADKDGRWMVRLKGLKSGSVDSMQVVGSNRIDIRDVLVGEVWVCSGQSNMELVLSDARNAPQEIAAADYPQLRVFTVSRSSHWSPMEDVNGSWKVCTPAEAARFTAVGYFFGREIHTALKMPVGLIHTSVGGSIAEAWVSREALATDPELDRVAEDQICALRRYPEDQNRFEKATAEWETKYGRDLGNKGLGKGWTKPDFDDSKWPKATLPTTFEKLRIQTGGSVWFRKQINLPDELANKPFTFVAGNGTEEKTAYFNGVELARIRTKPPFHDQKTSFRIPPELVHAGKNTMSVRVYSHTNAGGISQLPQKMGFPLKNPEMALSQWSYQIETAGPDLSPEARAALPHAPWASPNVTATQLFNGMVYGLIPYGIRGVIWYQGESNANRAYRYRRLLPLLIRDWRTRWGEGDFPFYIVQLASFQPAPTQPSPSAWAELREAQNMTAASVPNTGVAVAIDIGEADDIHPKNKQDVGRRLALLALAKTYHQQIEYSGPVYTSMAIRDGVIRLNFSHAEGLTAKGGNLKRFTIAGDDQKFVWADAKIDRASVVVSSPLIKKPVAVRYGWADNPSGCNLYNAAGLPASPFRTDDWPGITDIKPKTGN